MTWRFAACWALLVVLVQSSAAQDTKVLLPRSGSVYDLTRDPATKLSMANGAGAANSTVIQTALNSIGAGSGGRIRDPIYIPSGIYQHHGFVIGQQANGTAASSGGQFLGGGGYSASLNENGATTTLANTTRLVYTGPRSSGEAAITYVGFGWFIGPIENHGIRIVSAGRSPSDYADRDDDSKFPKCPIGFLVKSLGTGGVPNGKLFASMSFMGFDDAIKITGTPKEGNCDNLTWSFIGVDACNTMYHCDNRQSVTHLIYKFDTSYALKRVFYFEQGGDLHAWSGQLNGPNQTLLEIGPGYHWNFGPYEIRNVKIDNMADNPVLVKIAQGPRAPIPIVITGTVGGSCTYNAADLVQGELPGDQIYIRFTGEPKAAADFNAQSTVSEPPF